MASASALIDERIKELGDWRGKMLAKVRQIIHDADPEMVEEWKWMGTPVFFHGGIVCTGETYKSVVKMTFAKGAALKDPSGLFNSSLDGNVRRAIDIHEGEKINESALKDLIRAASGTQSRRQQDEAASTEKQAGPNRAMVQIATGDRRKRDAFESPLVVLFVTVRYTDYRQYEDAYKQILAETGVRTGSLREPFPQVSGIVASNFVPLPGVDVIANVPPRELIRSRILRNAKAIENVFGVKSRTIV